MSLEPATLRRPAPPDFGLDCCAKWDEAADLHQLRQCIRAFRCESGQNRAQFAITRLAEVTMSLPEMLCR